MKKVRYSSVMAVWAGLALGYFQSTLPAKADNLIFDVPASAARAQCHTSTGDGTWTFTITSLTNKISIVNVVLYTGSGPTNGGGGCNTTGGCGDTRPWSQAAGALINTPAVGKSVTVNVPAGVYCVRVSTIGTKGSSVIVQLTHP